MAALSYDAPTTLSSFASRYKLRFPLLSDKRSAVIRQFGLLNSTVERGSAAWGVPYPGTLFIDRQRRVVERSFEAKYQERESVGSMMTRLGADAAGPQVQRTTRHLSVVVRASDSQVAPGRRLSLVFDFTPVPRMHVYAPGAVGYRPLRISMDPRPYVRAHPIAYPPSEPYLFKPLNELVQVYQRPFSVVQPLTLDVAATEAALKSGPTLELSGRIDYQACDDKLCYNPASVPFSVTVNARPLVRERSARP